MLAASHQGTVKFGGLPLPGATVTATRGERNVTVSSGMDGTYSFPDLDEGAWKVRVEMQCFEPGEREVTVAKEAAAAEWDLKLLDDSKIDAVAAAPSAPSAPEANPQAAAAAAPTPAPAAAKKKNGKTSALAQSGFQKAEVHAVQGAAPPAPEAGIGESSDAAPQDSALINGSVNNSSNSAFSQSAAFGNNRRRRSDWNGALEWVVDHSALDARSYSLTGQNTPKPDSSRVQGSLTIGGRLRIPHVIERNAPYINLVYQWQRNGESSTSSNLMPLDAWRGGDLSTLTNASGAPVTVLDPTTGTAFAGNQIPEARISAQAKALVALYPRANLALSTSYNYQLALLNSTHRDTLQGVVQSMSVGRNSFSGNFAFTKLRSANTSAFGFLDRGRNQGVTTVFNWSRRLANVRRTFSVGMQFNRQAATALPHFSSSVDVSGAAGITGNNQEPVNWGPPALGFSSGIAPLSDGQYSASHNQTFVLTGRYQMNNSAHTVVLGGEGRRLQYNLVSQQNARGSFTFTGASTNSDFASFLLGLPDASAIAYGNADKYFRGTSYAAYVSDDWRALTQLTLMLGARWEYASPLTELRGRLVNLDIGQGFASASPVLASSPVGPVTGTRYPGTLLRPDRRNVQPRLGLAWRPVPGSSLIVRAGYSVTLDPSGYQSIATQMAQQAPLSKSMSAQSTAANPLTLANGFSTTAATTNTYAVDPGLRTGYAQTWTVSLQRDLPASLVATANYTGIKGTHASQQILPNTYPAGGSAVCVTCLSGYTYMLSGGNSIRHAGKWQLRRRLHSGFTAVGEYTFGKSLDNAALGGVGQSAAMIAQNWRDLGSERALSSFDKRHQLSLQTQYTSGMGLRGGALLGGWRGRLLTDWTLSTNLTASSGTPISPVYAALVGGSGSSGSMRPDYTGAAVKLESAGRHLNPLAVAEPAAGAWGNAGRNSIEGPSQFSLGATLNRTFRVGDRYTADFRVEAANVLNHVSFTRWNSTMGSTQFGLAAGAGAMRSLQSTLRVRF